MVFKWCLNGAVLIKARLDGAGLPVPGLLTGAHTSQHPEFLKMSSKMQLHKSPIQRLWIEKRCPKENDIVFKI